MSDLMCTVFCYFGIGCAIFIVGLLVMQALDKARNALFRRLRKRAEEAEKEAAKCKDLADAQADQIEWLKYKINKLEEQRDQQRSDSDTDGVVPDGGNGRSDDDDQGGAEE